MAKDKKQEPIPFSLRSVYCRAGKQWMAEDFDPMLVGQQLFGQFKSTPHRIDIREVVANTPEAKPIRSCLISTNFQFRYLNTNQAMIAEEDGDEKNFVAEISACFAVDYLIETPETPPQEMLEQWASSNALLHCWPYWREFCHSTLLRMNLPVTIMPMMVVEKKKE
jgi:hypothetical protein